MKNTISEMGNTPEGIKCRLDDTKECIRTLKYRVLKITEAKQQHILTQVQALLFSFNNKTSLGLR